MQRRLAAVLSADMAGYSRLMERDEEDTLRRQRTYLADTMEPEIDSFGGHMVKRTGDGVLAEFGSALDAVRCAVAMQIKMEEREGQAETDRRIAYRVGVNLGDVVFDAGDVFGDGVNVAARLQGLSRPGGVCISDVVHQLVADRVDFHFRDMGSQRVKNISRPIRVWQWTPDGEPAQAKTIGPSQRQRIRFTSASDGVQLAWADMGEGKPVLKAPNWLNHLEYEWRSPIWGPVCAELVRRIRLIRFDQRGNGLSEWEVDEISERMMTDDMATVANAAGLERFALLGISQGSAYSVRYAVEHPEQVTCIVIFGGYLRGRNMRPDPEQRRLYDALTVMIRDGWGSPNPVFRHFFTSNYIPDASPEIGESFDELQRISTSPANALRLWETNANIDVTELARSLRVPTLVLHCVGDRVCPIEEGRRLARLVPDADFVELPGSNHVPLAGTPAFDRFVEEMLDFLGKHNR
jgi:class 3 adenylate cyclase/pimeloyl-ACP methyl ester carboxylesterase